MKFDEKLALSVYLDETIPDENKISATGFVYLASVILGKEIQDLDKCYYADAKKCFDKLLPIDDEKCLLVRNCYGLDDKKPLSLKEAGLQYHDGVTQERVRQVLCKTIRDLRHIDNITKIYSVFSKKEYSKNMEKFQASNKVNNYQYLTIDDLNFSVRTYNCLIHAGINTVSELLDYDFPEILEGLKRNVHSCKIRNFGKKSCEEVIKKLYELGYELNNYEHHYIGNIEFSTRTYNCLKRDGINTISDLLEKIDDISKIRNLGKKSYEEIMTKLTEAGY